MNEISVLSVGAAHGFLNVLSEQLASSQGLSLKVEYGTVGDTKSKVAARSDCQIAILSVEVLEDLSADGVISPDNIALIGDVSAAFAVRANDTLPQIGDRLSLLRTLVSAPAIFVPSMSSSTAGKHFRKLATNLGVYDTLASTIREGTNGADAMRALVASDMEGALGFTQSTEIVSTSGLRLCSAVPEEFGLETTYGAGLCLRFPERQNAARFLRFLDDTDLDAERRIAGFRPPRRLAV